ncbi:MAG: hypothetical protein H6R15_3856 [Proteobacteria bacterium]|nr:hypothetical protein [Pseudomonadota bacterium]
MPNTNLEQRSFPFTKLRFTIEGNRELVVEHSTPFRSTRQALPLHLIDPSPIHHRSIPFGWVVITLVSLLLTVSALYAGWRGEGPGELFGVLLLTGIFLACLYNTIRLSSNALHFRNVNTAAVMLTLFRSKPSSAEVDAFVEKLRNQIQSFRTPASASTEEVVALYVKHLDYLLQNDVLHRSEYDAAMQRLNERASNRKVFELVR